MAEQNAYPIYPGWETVRKIGAGSFGAVYEIERDLFGQKEKAALKVLSIPQSESDVEELYSNGYDNSSITEHFKGCLEDIIREYQLMAEMKGHTNSVYCDDIRYVQKDDGFGWDIYIKMELLTSLTKIVDGKTSEEQVIKLGMDISNALALCRSRNIIHRDIKPQNIFVSRDGDFKLGDFGIAKTVEKTSGGTKIGTYNYMAPEVYNNAPYGHAADIYSLGLVMYWMLNERRMPFVSLPPVVPKPSENEAARLRRFQGDMLPAPLNGSKGLKRIVLKACAYDPKDRYSTAEELREDLQSLIHPSSVQLPIAKQKAEQEPKQNLIDSLTCEVCGAAITEKTAVCMKCGSETGITIGPFDRICPYCGCITAKKDVKCSECGKCIITEESPIQTKKNPKWLWIGAMIAVVVVAGLAIRVGQSNRSVESDKTASTNTNINNATYSNSQADNGEPSAGVTVSSTPSTQSTTQTVSSTPAPELNIKQTLVTVDAAGVNLRTGPGLEYDIVDYVYKGRQYDLLGSDNGWYKISYKGNPAWINQRFADKVDGGNSIIVARGAANIRGSKTDEKNILATLIDGDVLTQVGIDGKFSVVDYNGQTGYVLRNLVVPEHVGWFLWNDNWYYADENGFIQTGWQYIDNNWYYLSKKGILQTGWIESGGNWYYTNEDGALITNQTMTIDGVKYTFDSEGLIVDYKE